MNEKLNDFLKTLRNNEKIKLYDEAATKQAIILKILKYLDWNIYDIDEVQPEFSTENKRVDYSLKNEDINKVFIEVKRVGKNLNDYEEQLLRYSFQEGVRVSILTDGLLWNFYLPLKEGNWKSRKILSLNILENDIEDISDIFMDVLSKKNVNSNEGIKLLKTHSEKFKNKSKNENNMEIKTIQLKNVKEKVNKTNDKKNDFNLNNFSDTVLIVPAGFGLQEYNELGIYLCQPNRFFRPAKYIGFYKKNKIEKCIPEILGWIENINLKRDKLEENSIVSYNGNHKEVYNRLLELKNQLPIKERYDENHKILILSLSQDNRTINLIHDVINDMKSKDGKNIAFTQNQTYISFKKILISKTTSELK